MLRLPGLLGRSTSWYDERAAAQRDLQQFDGV